MNKTINHLFYQTHNINCWN